MINKSKTERLHDLIPKLFKTRSNPNWKAMVEAFGESDEFLSQLIQEVRKQFFIKTASRPYIDRLGSNVKVSRPRLVGMDDASFRAYVPVLAYQPKQVKLVIDKLLDIFFFKESTTTFIQSTAFENFALESGWSLSINVDSIYEENITFNTDGSILLSGLGSILIDISLYGYAYAYAGSEENGYYNSSADIDYINAGPTSNNLVDTTAEAQGTPEYDSSTSIGYFADFGLSNSSTCEIQHAMTGYYAGIDGETMAYGYVKITAAKISGTSTNVTILYNKWDIDQFGVISVLYEA